MSDNRPTAPADAVSPPDAVSSSTAAPSTAAPTSVAVPSSPSKPASASPPTIATLASRATILPPCARYPCASCGKARSRYCGDCLSLTVGGPALPTVSLPCPLWVVRGREESTAKATSGHAGVLAAPDVSVFVPPVLPPLPQGGHPPRTTLLLFPSPAAVRVSALSDDALFNPAGVVVLDCTWGKAGTLLQTPGLRDANMTHVSLGVYSTLFWRFQPLGPQCVSTIEAVFLLYRELHSERVRRCLLREAAARGEGVVSPASASAVGAQLGAEGGGWGLGLTLDEVRAVPPEDPANTLYDGRYDDLCCLFLETYARVQAEYTTSGKTFTTRHRPGYIQGASGGGAGGGGNGEGAPNEEQQQQQRPKRIRGAWTVSTSAMDGTAAAQEGARVKRAVPGVEDERAEVVAFEKRSQR